MGLIAALTHEHDGWEQGCLRTSGERSRAQCLVLSRLRGGTRYLTESAPRFMPPRKRRHEQVILSILDISTTRAHIQESRP
jgi:hypothetical protein